jgi:hypothetical protein
MNVQATPLPDKTATGTYWREGRVDPTSRSGCFKEKNYLLALESLTLGPSDHSHATFRAIPGFRQHLAR